MKPLLYVYRVLLTGIHLMRTGVVEANLVHLQWEYPIEGLEELIALKVEGAEKATLPTTNSADHKVRVQALTARLQAEGKASTLPELPSARKALSDLLVRLRLGR